MGVHIGSDGAFYGDVTGKGNLSKQFPSLQP